MKKAIFILFLFSSNFIIGQDFAQLGAKWHFKKYCPTPDWFNDCGYFTLESIRDTTLLGKTSKIIEFKDNEVVIPNGQLILRSDSNRVYFFESGQFKLLYDFNLVVGDTLVYSVPYNWKNYDLACSFSPDTSKKAQAIIDSVVFITISGQSLKSFYTSPVPLTNINYFSWSLGQIIERIGGSSLGIIGQSSAQCLSGYLGHFRCYSDSLINYHPVPENCDFITGIETINNRNNLNIYPNPTSTYFTIKGLNEPYDLTIFNSVGQLLYEAKNVFESTKKVDVENLKEGILLIQIKSEKEVYYYKILKSKS